MPWIPFFGRAGLRGSGVLSTGRMQDGTWTGRERWPVTRTFSGATSREVDPTRIYRATRTTENAIDGDGFVARAYLPGHLEPEDTDHGRGPLATIMESFLAPGTHIKLHEHVADEIVLWVPTGVMRHDAPEGGHLTPDADHLMVMNAGWGLRREERVRNDDPPRRML